MLLNQNPLLEVILVEKENKKRRVKGMGNEFNRFLKMIGQ
jgi:hypothetical protein